MELIPKNALLSLVVLAAAMLIAAVPSAADDKRATAAATKGVTVGDNYFSRRSTSIRRNDRIRFKWDRTRKRHNVAVRSGPVKFKSRTKRGTYTYTKKFTRKGTYRLYCTIHPSSMKTTVRVR